MGNGVPDPDKLTDLDKENDAGWARALGHDVPGDAEPQPEQRPTSDHGRPVDDGPGQHRANARTDYTPTRPGKVQDF